MTTLAAADPSAATADAGGYTARHLSVLEGLDAVRKRPGMYIGSTDGRGLQHCLWEIFDNSVDEALAGHCSRIEVVLHADGSAEVRDNGRGIPVDVEPKTKLTGVELVMTRLHAGGKFGNGSYTASGGLHGVGASVVNALASRLDIEVDRDGHTWATSFRRGVTGEFTDNGEPSPGASFTRRGGLRQIRRVAKKVTGTRTRFWPDRQVFVRDARFSFTAITERARQTAYLVPGLAIHVRDERPAPAAPVSAGAVGPGWLAQGSWPNVPWTGRIPRRRRPPPGPARRSSASTAASASSASTWRPASRSPTCCGWSEPESSPRPCRCSTTGAT